MINLLLSETKRSEIYLKYIKKNKIKINKIIFFADRKKNVNRLIESKNLKNKTTFVNSNNINSKLVEKAILRINNSFPIIYSGYSGVIIKNKKILKRNLIHFHPGELPLHKGSTTMFYSLILNKKITVTCFIMSSGIDEGKILYKKNFKPPSKLSSLNDMFDHKIRAETMIDFLKKGKRKYKAKKQLNNFSIYYIAHPIIRGIAIHNKKLKQLYL